MGRPVPVQLEWSGPYEGFGGGRPRSPATLLGGEPHPVPKTASRDGQPAVFLNSDEASSSTGTNLVNTEACP
ncbi:hypothetical protein FRAHR75_1860004 [Frankia sp. Hr75.2]|nr:hypothetical protein FRAHR75_1860004 [Frankia sp. Hr75.2]